MDRPFSLFRILAALAVAAASGGCAAPDAPRRAALPAGLTWGGYLHGEDLRQRCDDGAVDRYRLVVNGRSPGERARIFEVSGTAEEGGRIEARLLPVGRVAELRVGDPAGIAGGPSDLLPLTPDQFRLLTERLARGGAFLPPWAHLDLSGSKLSWYVTGCHAGRFFLAAYAKRPGSADEA